MSLRSISFASYKRFSEKETLRLAPITILVGKNSSGKSSVLKLFPMLENSFSGQLKRSVIKYDNSGVVLGSSYSDIASNGVSVDLTFGVDLESGLAMEAVLMSQDNDVMISEYMARYADRIMTLKIRKDDGGYFYLCKENAKRYSMESFSGLVNKSVFEELGCPAEVLSEQIKVDYIGPIRQMPQRVYTYKGGESDGKVGIDGNAAYDMLYESEDLQQKVSDWYKKNFEGTKLLVKNIERGSYQVKLQKDNGQHVEVNLADEGQGMSQVLPIVVRCLMNDMNSSIVVMEQPELHLHPAAHANLARLFADTAKERNRQYVIETQSENILLGIRDAVVDEECPLSKDDVLIYFVDEDENGGAYLKMITINERGDLSDWPTGVFNEAYEILNSIREKVSKHNNI